MAGPANIVSRVAPSPSTTERASELLPEQSEDIPYPLGAYESAGADWPPTSFATTEESTTVSSSLESSLPESLDLEFVQGDTFTFQRTIDGVSYTAEDPQIDDPGAPTWVETEWTAQIRNPYIQATWSADFWVPANSMQYAWWRQNSLMAEFDVQSELIMIPDTDPVEWGTQITLTLAQDDSSDLIPGAWYRWDVQSAAVDGSNRVTHYRGRVRVVSEWTI